MQLEFLFSSAQHLGHCNGEGRFGLIQNWICECNQGQEDKRLDNIGESYWSDTLWKISHIGKDVVSEDWPT